MAKIKLTPREVELLSEILVAASEHEPPGIDALMKKLEKMKLIDLSGYDWD